MAGIEFIYKNLEVNKGCQVRPLATAGGQRLTGDADPLPEHVYGITRQMPLLFKAAADTTCQELGWPRKGGKFFRFDLGPVVSNLPPEERAVLQQASAALPQGARDQAPVLTWQVAAKTSGLAKSVVVPEGLTEAAGNLLFVFLRQLAVAPSGRPMLWPAMARVAGEGTAWVPMPARPEAESSSDGSKDG
ncbi:hypothetical protein GPECTOR_17g981 [Gonium pectorale]|uniref:Uncharacterized protein n=1 Tax=Gonium pectorale TaxID=33097 RepID=A0A150GLZ2_GONPE|nr:hypothetical protein GPECTOR_17g981 [Gonium pectorale]|eukprot:KXZ50340.1 hypothetical protein GPECTOR_17g981 [Gonium pectorale]